MFQGYKDKKFTTNRNKLISPHLAFFVIPTLFCTVTKIPFLRIATRTGAAFNRRFMLRVLGEFVARGCLQLSTCTFYVCGILRRGTVAAEQGMNSKNRVTKDNTMLQHAIQTCFLHFTMCQVLSYYCAFFLFSLQQMIHTWYVTTAFRPTWR